MADTFSREAVGIFHDEKALRSAADALMISGFDRSYLSLLASDRAVDEKLGHHVQRVAELEDDPDVPTQAYVGSDSRVEGQAALIGGLVYVGAIASIGAIVASGGAATPVLIGAAVAGGGAGGALGAVLARVVGKAHATRLETQIGRGGLLLWVRTPDTEHEQRAIDILKQHGAEDVHVHTLPGEMAHRTDGVSRELSFMSALGL
jgi:hypothetical protein